LRFGIQAWWHNKKTHPKKRFFMLFGGVDGISATKPNSKNIDSHMEKTGNSKHPVKPDHNIATQLIRSLLSNDTFRQFSLRNFWDICGEHNAVSASLQSQIDRMTARRFAG
jgi:hypothetical protein